MGSSLILSQKQLCEVSFILRTIIQGRLDWDGVTDQQLLILVIMAEFEHKFPQS